MHFFFSQKYMYRYSQTCLKIKWPPQGNVKSGHLLMTGGLALFQLSFEKAPDQ